MSQTARERAERLYSQVEWQPTLLHSPEVGSGHYVPRRPTQEEVQAEIETAERAAFAEGRRAGLEDVCALVCRGCCNDWPVSWGIHTDDEGEKSYCEASMIRDHLAREARSEDGQENASLDSD